MAADIFAKLGDIKGESLDDKHKDEVELLSWSWGVANIGRRASSHGFQRKRYGLQVTPSSLPSITISGRLVVITANNP